MHSVALAGASPAASVFRLESPTGMRLKQERTWAFWRMRAPNALPLEIEASGRLASAKCWSIKRVPSLTSK